MVRDLFSILGPCMIGPSSSHTAGAAKIGLMCRAVAGDEIKSVTFYLHGSFATTYKGHGTDRALVGGILGMKTDDENIVSSLEIAKKKGIKIKFIKAELGNVHPNTVKAEFINSKGVKSSLVASSIGGGVVKVVFINGFDAKISGRYEALIISHKDEIGMIRRITSVLEEYKLNIVSLYNSRESRKGNAVTIVELDSKVKDDTLKKLEDIKYINSVSYIHKV